MQQRQQKPDYIAALLGVVCCGCAYSLATQNRGGPSLLTDHMAGRWEISSTPLLSTTSSLAAAEISSWSMAGNASKLGNGGRLIGKVESEDGWRRFTLDSTATFGRLVLQGEDASTDGLVATFNYIEVKGARVGNGWYKTEKHGEGRMELAVGKESWVLHLVPADGGAVTVTGARLTPAAERSELTDKVVLAFFVFVVAVVVSLIRTALFPAVKKSPAPATAQQLRQAKKAFVPGVAG